MIIKPDGSVRYLSVAEHLQRKSLVYQDQERSIVLTNNKHLPFTITRERGKAIYIDLFALQFGVKEQLRLRSNQGWKPIHYGCKRCERDKILYLPVDQVIEEENRHTCPEQGCQYWSNPTGVKGRYAINCILIRYRALGILEQKTGLTLEEVGRIYACTRERIRQIEDRALRRLRHQTRASRLETFREHIADYRDYTRSMTSDIA